MKTQEILKQAQTIVIKVGTALVALPDGSGPYQDWIDALAADVKALHDQGKKVLIVSSGAVAMGRKALGIGLDVAPSSIPLERKQAASAVGQFHIFHAYHDAFAAQGITLAQVLLTMSETENRRMHLNARATLAELMDNGIIPIVNENDTISTGELRFGDNDRLAARVAQMIDAEAVVLLSTTDGLYTDNPDKTPNARHIPVVEKVAEDHLSMAGEAIPGLSTGGMKSKVEAAMAANAASISLVVGHGRALHALKAIFEDENTRTTVFLATNTRQNAKKRWLGSHLSPKGIIIVDQGAVSALQSGKSLLPVGIKAVEGVFERGDVVEIRDNAGQSMGMGISAYSASDAQKIIGRPSGEIPDILGYAGRDELIHRNDMVLQDS